MRVKQNTMMCKTLNTDQSPYDNLCTNDIRDCYSMKPLTASEQAITDSGYDNHWITILITSDSFHISLGHNAHPPKKKRHIFSDLKVVSDPQDMVYTYLLSYKSGSS